MKTLFWAFLMLSGWNCLAQSSTNPPAIEWQQTIHGWCGHSPKICTTADGGLILGATFIWEAYEQPKNPGFGRSDYGVVRMNARGEVLWRRPYGGTEPEHFTTIEPTPDGGFILGGSSDSPPSGNKTSPRFGANMTEGDYWVVRIDGEGNILWDRSFGGAKDDLLTSIQRTPDGGFLLGGYSFSEPSGNKTSPSYDGELNCSDYWVIKLDGQGNKLWERTYGGWGHDKLQCVQKVQQGGYLLVGASNSRVSDTKTISVWPAVVDIQGWVLRIDEEGGILWQQIYTNAQVSMTGSSAYDARAACPASDGGFLLGGRTTVTKMSFWIARIDPEGKLLWERTIGGDDELYRWCWAVTAMPDGGFMVGGGMKPITPDGTGTFGEEDYWVLRYDKDGNKLWDQQFGGSWQDSLYGLTLSPDGGVVLAGFSTSGISGNKTAPQVGGGYDAWIVKLQPDVVHLRMADARLNPNPDGASRFILTGPPAKYIIEDSPDCVSWKPLQTNQLVIGPLEIVAPEASGNHRRFYRAWMFP